MEAASSSHNHAEEFLVGIRSIHIRTTEVLVSTRWTVGQLKAKLTELENLHGKAIRVIYHGRALEDTSLLRDAGIHAGSIVHVSVGRNQARPSAAQHARGNTQPGRQHAQDDDVAATGFDRLTEMGFSAEDVRQFRLQFYLHHLRTVPAGQTVPAMQAAELLQLENQWIDQTFNPARDAPATEQEPANTLAQARTLQSGLALATDFVTMSESNGTGFNLLAGLIVGFLLGFIALFWITEPHLSRKTRIGMIVGISANLCFGFLAFTRTLSAATSTLQAEPAPGRTTKRPLSLQAILGLNLASYP